MSTTTLAITFLAGMVVSPLLIWMSAPFFDAVAKFIVKLGIRSGGDWVLKPQGSTEYTLETVEYDSTEGKAWRAGGEDDSDREYFDDDGGRMRTLFGKSFGLAVEDVSAIVDPVDCVIGKAEGERIADGGEITSQTQMTVEELRDRAHIGSLEKTVAQSDGGRLTRRLEFVNPFVSVDNQDHTVVDVRDAVSLLSRNASPDTARKTAENAAAAERAFDDWGELTRNASLIAAFLMGAIVTEFIAGGGGGGGGGGSVVSLMIHNAAVLSWGL